jgi:hypothetical protein
MGWQVDHRLVPFSGLNSMRLKNKNEMEWHIFHWIFSLIVHQRRMEKLVERVFEKIK